MSANLKKHLATLSKRGRNRVLVGDLDYAGITGKVYTPAEGQSLPAVAFGHDWMHKIKDCLLYTSDAADEATIV